MAIPERGSTPGDQSYSAGAGDLLKAKQLTGSTGARKPVGGSEKLTTSPLPIPSAPPPPSSQSVSFSAAAASSSSSSGGIGASPEVIERVGVAADQVLVSSKEEEEKQARALSRTKKYITSMKHDLDETAVLRSIQSEHISEAGRLELLEHICISCNYLNELAIFDNSAKGLYDSFNLSDDSSLKLLNRCLKALTIDNKDFIVRFFLNKYRFDKDNLLNIHLMCLKYDPIRSLDLLSKEDFDRINIQQPGFLEDFALKYLPGMLKGAPDLISKLDIKNMPAKNRIVLSCGNAAPSLTLKNIEQFGITDQDVLKELAMICGKKFPLSVSYFDNIGLLEPEKIKKDLQDWLIERNPLELFNNLDRFGITDINKILDIAKKCLQIEPDEVSFLLPHMLTKVVGPEQLPADEALKGRIGQIAIKCLAMCNDPESIVFLDNIIRSCYPDRDAESIFFGLDSKENASPGWKALDLINRGYTKAVKAFIKNCKENMALAGADVVKQMPVFGPQEKTQESFMAEEMLTNLLKNFSHYEIIEDAGKYYVMESGDYLRYQVPEGAVPGTSEGDRVELGEFLKKVNFNHITFTDEQMAAYNHLIPVLNSYGTSTAGGYVGEGPLHLSYPTSGLCSELTPAEKNAINIYTGNENTAMIRFMQGRLVPALEGVPFTVRSARLKSLFITSAMAVSALNKLPDYDPPTDIKGVKEKFLFRYDGSLRPEVMGIRQKCVQEGGGATLEQAFISTSHSKPAEDWIGGSVVTLFYNCKGKYIAPLSQHPHEREVLLPPTEVMWKYHYEFYVAGEKKHVFFAKPVTVVHDTPTLPKTGE